MTEFMLAYVLPIESTISGADERVQRSPTPHHVTPIGAARSMANPKSTLPPVHSRSANGTPLYEKVCACGAVAIVDKRKLGTPCHACAMKARRTHGYSSGSHGHLNFHPLYKVWNSIKVRCNYPSATHYRYYGGRGISLCAEWANDPRAFVEWATAHGWRKGMEIDRVDPNGNYSPDNCRLLSHQENSQRTRRIKTTPEQVRLVIDRLNVGDSIKSAARCAGVTYMVAWHIKNSPGVWSNLR